ALAGTAGKVAGRLGEGAVYGVTGSVSHANVTGDPLSIESVVTDAGVGALLNYGLGKISDGVVGLSNKAKARIAAETAQEKVINVLDRTPESYNELVTATKSTVQSAKAAQKEWDKAAAKYYEEFKTLGSDPKALRQLIADVDIVERKALDQLAKGQRRADYLIKQAPGSIVDTPAAVRSKLTDTDRAILNKVRDILGKARVEATKSFNGGNHGDVITKLSGAIEDAKNLI